jgi:acyl-CoA reductase-like NAD-dependent aldehyde dehydrogenase
MKSMQKFPMILAGRSSTPNQSLVVVDKYTQQPLATVPLASQEHVALAIEAAYRSRPLLQRLSGFERHRILMHASRRVEESAADFESLLVSEAGKPIAAARLEVQRCIETLRLSAEEATRLHGRVLPMDGSPRGTGYLGMTRRFPVGVCSLITPFNFPLNLVAHKVGPAIAAGCPFILKPASWTPLCSLMLGDILIESGLPPESFSVLPCSRHEAEALITDDRIAMLSFTGSDEVGWKMKRDCGRKRICLELGGNACCIVDQEFPWQGILSKLISAAFSQSGQSCISLQRLLIHESLYDALTSAVVDAASHIVCGDPNLESTVVGPMIDAKEADRLQQWVDQAAQSGAHVLLAGQRREGTNVITPWILESVDEQLPLSCQEAFGPVLIVEKFHRFEEAMSRVNRSKYGLQTGIFTQNLSHAMLAWETLEVGGVVIGDTPNTRFDAMPYGGVKASGIGREGVAYAIEEMTAERLLLINGQS